MSNLQIFSNSQFGEIRVTKNDNGEPLFCLADVCDILSLGTTQVRQRLSDDVVSNYPISDKLGRSQLANFVTEEGFYDVVLDSRKPEAKAFRKWVTSEVLPTIRKHGAYLTPSAIEEVLTNPDTIIRIAQQLKSERAAKELAQQQYNQIKPLADLATRILDNDEKIDIGQAAKILELPFGRNTLFAKLRECGIFFKNRNEPKQEYIQRGYFQLKERWIERNNHDSFMVVKVLVTQKGLAYISQRFEANPKQKKLILIS